MDDIKVFLHDKIKDSRFSISYKVMSSIENFFDTTQPSPQIYNSNGILKALFYECQMTDGVVMVSSIIDGWESLCFQLSSFISDEIYIIHFDDRKSSETYNGFSFLLNGRIVRVIYSMKDPEWKFYSYGDSLWFEDLEFYKKRNIKDRMNKFILKEYCNELGLHIEEEDFWKIEGRSLLFEYIPDYPVSIAT